MVKSEFSLPWTLPPPHRECKERGSDSPLQKFFQSRPQNFFRGYKWFQNVPHTIWKRLGDPGRMVEEKRIFISRRLCQYSNFQLNRVLSKGSLVRKKIRDLIKVWEWKVSNQNPKSKFRLGTILIHLSKLSELEYEIRKIKIEGPI